MPIEVRCECGQRLRASENQAGTQHKCPKCNRIIRVPARTAANPQPANLKPSTTAASNTSEPIHIHPAAPKPTGGLATPFVVVIAVWVALALFVVTSRIVSAFETSSLALFIIGSLVLGALAAGLLTARMRVLKAGDVPLVFGLLRLIAWEPTEGIVILKNKAVTFVDDNLADAGGGIRVIYPVLGEVYSSRFLGIAL